MGTAFPENPTELDSRSQQVSRQQDRPRLLREEREHRHCVTADVARLSLLEGAEPSDVLQACDVRRHLQWRERLGWRLLSSFHLYVLLRCS